MNKTILFILTTAIGFAAGIFAGMWIRSNPPIPAPPAAVLDEVKEAPLGSNNAAPDTAQNTLAVTDPRREAALRQIRAEMDEFMTKVREIKTTFREQTDTVLDEKQREIVRRWRERPTPPSAPATPSAPSTNPRSARNFYEGFESTITIIMVPFSLERLDDDLKFTPAQKEAVHKILLDRRAKFLELVDTTPPPSFKLLKLAPPEAKVGAEKN